MVVLGKETHWRYKSRMVESAYRELLASRPAPVTLYTPPTTELTRPWKISVSADRRGHSSTHHKALVVALRAIFTHTSTDQWMLNSTCSLLLNQDRRWHMNFIRCMCMLKSRAGLTGVPVCSSYGDCNQTALVAHIIEVAHACSAHPGWSHYFMNTLAHYLNL